jgi:hypothetical protein
MASDRLAAIRQTQFDREFALPVAGTFSFLILITGVGDNHCVYQFT